MANTTFTGPVVALNGFIGGPNPNAQDTAQGGKTPWTVSTSNVVQNATTGETLSAAGNEGVMIYVQDGFSNAPTYAFSNGTAWIRMQTTSVVIATNA